MTEERGPNFARWFRAIVVVWLVTWMGSHLLPPVNLDVGCLLYAAKRWISGDRLYVDVIDPNTPWAIGLHVPAEVLAKYLGLDGPTWFSFCVMLAVGISTALTWSLARRSANELGPLVTALLPLLSLFILGVDAGRCFGQREHLLMIGAYPYLILSSLRGETSDGAVALPLRLRFCVALVAGLAFTIKPHFLLPLTLVELLLLVRQGPARWFRDLVPWTIFSIQCAHALFALVFTPEYLEVIVPFTAEMYADPSHLGERALAILLGVELGPVTLLLPLLIAAARFARTRLGPVLSAFIVGAAAMSALQGKGWDYHSLPAVEATFLFIGVLVARLIERSSESPLRAVGAPAGLAVALLLPFLWLCPRNGRS